MKTLNSYMNMTLWIHMLWIHQNFHIWIHRLWIHSVRFIYEFITGLWIHSKTYEFILVKVPDAGPRSVGQGWGPSPRHPPSRHCEVSAQSLTASGLGCQMANHMKCRAPRRRSGAPSPLGRRSPPKQSQTRRHSGPCKARARQMHIGCSKPNLFPGMSDPQKRSKIGSEQCMLLGPADHRFRPVEHSGPARIFRSLVVTVSTTQNHGKNRRLSASTPPSSHVGPGLHRYFPI